MEVPESAIEAMKGAWPAANYPVLVRPDEATPERMEVAAQREKEIFGGALEAALPALRSALYKEFAAEIRERSISDELLAFTRQGVFQEFSEKLLSDEAVEADARARWLEISDDALEQSRAGLQAALQAIGEDDS
jgi:hypothetical protein